MSLLRFGYGAVIACGLAWFSLSAKGDDLKSELTQAETELAHAAATDPSHPDPSTDPLSVDPDLAVWTFVVFIVLLVVLKKFAWGPILHALEGREHGIAEHIAQAERNHDEAKRVLAQYEQKLTLAANEVRDLMEQARKDAEQAKQAILADAKAGAEAERVRSLRDIEAATDQAMESLAARSAQLAVELAGKILGSELNKDSHAKLIQDAIAKFPAQTSSVN